MLINGKWTTNRPLTQSTNDKGAFVRVESSFRNWVTPDGSVGPTGGDGFAAAADRYHLYVALSCPWASRTLMARTLKGLERIVSVSVVEPAISDEGWHFGNYPGSGQDCINGARHLHEIYTRADPGYTGRVTVPVLWDKVRKTVVNNESADIVRMFNTGFGTLANPSIDLYPAELSAQIDELNAFIYDGLNNGFYRAGFATSQAAYDEAFQAVFDRLDTLEQRLSARKPFLFSDHFTETDIRLFVTLVRFDAAYHGLFKCNRHRIADYPALSAYLRRVVAVPGIRQTVNIDHIKQGYYAVRALNPNGIVPLGPQLDWIKAGD